MAEVLQVKKRTSRGTRQARRERAGGAVPAILYGHGKESVSLSIDGAEISAALRHGTQLVDLAGELKEKALIREVQWDTFATRVLHVDFTRVDADEKIQVTVPVDLRGDAPGTKVGGTVEHVTHEIELECAAEAIPEKLEMNINTLNLNESLLVSDLELAPGMTLITPPDQVIVQCVEQLEEAESEEGGLESVEPEVIGRKPDEEQEGS